MLPNPNLQRTVRQIIYNLKHSYGAPVDVYHMETAETDYRTGVKSSAVSKVSVRHAVVMPADAMRKFFQGVSYITESKAFSSPGGAGWDQDVRGFIFDGKDMPGYEWELEDWIVYDGKKYEVSTIQDLEFDTGWMIIGKRIRGSDPEQIIDVNIVDTMDVESEGESS